MKTNQNLKKIALFASVFAVLSLATVNAAETENNVSDEPAIVNKGAATNPDGLCPNGNPRGTRAENCTVGGKGRQGNFAKGRAGNNRQGNFAKGRAGNNRHGNFSNGRGNGGRGHVARSGGRQGNFEGRRGMGPGKGLGNGQGAHDGSCVQASGETAES